MNKLSTFKPLIVSGESTSGIRSFGSLVLHRTGSMVARLGLTLALLGSICIPAPLMAENHLVHWGGDSRGSRIIFDSRVFNQPLTQVCAGNGHFAALRADGTVVAWGAVSYGQGNVPAGLSNVKAIAAGSTHTVALKNDGTVVAWGDNWAGQTDVPPGLSNVKAIAAGIHHTVALRDDGSLVAWGLNNNGQTDIPAGLSPVDAIAAGEVHTVALLANGAVVAWGLNNDNQVTVPANALSGVKAVAAGYGYTLALKADGTLVGWGSNVVGNGTAGISNVKAIAGGPFHAVALKHDGAVVAWGSNNQGELDVPQNLNSVKSVAAGYSSTLALEADGTLVGWGIHYPGQLKDVKTIAGGAALKTDGTVVPWGEETHPPAGLSGITDISTSRHDAHALALKSDGTVIAWGYSPYGQTTVPPGLSGVKAIVAGLDHSLALLSNGVVVAWGLGETGQTTVPPGALNGVKAIVAGSRHSVALKEDGTVIAWGENHQGATDVPAGLKNVKAISAGDLHTVALKNDGTVVAWGSDEHGQCTVPAGLNNVRAVKAGYLHSVALKNDGTVVAWGRSDEGQTDVPPGLSGVSDILAGYFTTTAIIAIEPSIITTGPPIRVHAGPEDVMAQVGQSQTFTVAAQGAAPLTYQWRRNGVAIAKATGNTLALTNLQRTQAGVYDVVVKNTRGVTLSNAINLSFPPLIPVVAVPLDTSASLGQTTGFRVTVPGATAWQWLKNGVAIKGATSTVLVVPNVDAASAGLYSVTVTTPNGKFTTGPAQLRLSDPGLLIYKLTGTGTAYTGATATAAALAGFLVLDRAGQRGGLIISSKSGTQNIHRVELHPNLHTQSTGPVPKTQTVVSEMVEDELTLWLNGADSLLTISKTDKAVGPATLKGFANSINLGSGVRIETVSLSLSLDAASSAPARTTQETVEQAITRMSLDMQAKGSAPVE